MEFGSVFMEYDSVKTDPLYVSVRQALGDEILL
jgi:hypothetical protein